MTYGSENWAFYKKITKAVISFETWCVRRMMGIKWKDFVRNEEIWKRSKFKEGTSIRLIMRQQMTFLGHIPRADGIENLHWKNTG